MEHQSKGHAIMISVPYQGHINPFTNLALKLASKGITVTFVHLEHVHHKLSKAHLGTKFDFFSEARESGLDIRYATISDGLPLEFDRNIHFEEYWEIMMHDFPARADEFVGKMINSDPYSCFFLVTDTIYAWPGAIADKYGIVNVSFWTQPAMIFSLLYHLDLLKERGHFPCHDKDEEINYIPGVKSINTKDLMSFLKEPEIGNIVVKTLTISFDRVKKADFILHNTVQELESETLSALNNYQPNYAIGPINFSTDDRPTTSLWAESDCTHWLDSKSPGSVLYVSFGSFVRTSKRIIEEIAYGLLVSEVNFIWVVREGILDVAGDDANVLPVGFVDDIEGKGIVVPWCNQIRVLSNPAVGGFLTHNGWNSTVESMRCGVPMICYPLMFDQPTNRKLVVDDWKIGINLCDRGGDSVDRYEVADRIKSCMDGGSVSRSLRMEADKVKGVTGKAWEIEGSSERNFDRFTKDLEVKTHAKNKSERRKSIGS